LSTAQIRLAVLWLLSAALIFVLFLWETVTGKVGTDWQKAWAWFLPTVVPTLSLIVGGVVFASRDPATASNTVDRSLFWLAYLLSAFYLIVVIGTLLLMHIALGGTKTDPLVYLSSSSVWLIPIQGVVGLALGAFFTSRQ
jgi:hypothetical protein